MTPASLSLSAPRDYRVGKAARTKRAPSSVRILGTLGVARAGAAHTQMENACILGLLLSAIIILQACAKMSSLSGVERYNSSHQILTFVRSALIESNLMM